METEFINTVTQRINNLFDSLADAQRRRLLFALLETEQLPGDATYLDTPPDGILAEEFDRIKRLHVHLPKLNDYGFVEWNPHEGGIGRGPEFEEVRPVLEALREQRAEVPQL